MSDALNKTEIWQLSTSLSPSVYILLVFPKNDEFFPRERSSSFFNSCSERGRISPYVGPSSMFVNILGEHCKERGRAGTDKRLKATYCQLLLNDNLIPAASNLFVPPFYYCPSLHYFSTVWWSYYYPFSHFNKKVKRKDIHKNIDTVVAFHSALQNCEQGRQQHNVQGTTACKRGFFVIPLSSFPEFPWLTFSWRDVSSTLRQKSFLDVFEGC